MKSANCKLQNGELKLREIECQNDLMLLEKLAADDDHGLVYPTHLVMKGDEVVGYVSLCVTPIVNVWMSTKKTGARDSVKGLRLVDELVREAGVPEFVMPCAKESPYYAVMERLGFSKMGENVWFLRRGINSREKTQKTQKEN